MNEHTFSSAKPLLDLVEQKNKGNHCGIFSLCTAHDEVLRASMTFLKNENAPLLIESTCNQVNQHGGYTKMKPNDFARFIRKIAHSTEFPCERIILGGDHLGINPWTDLPIDRAMAEAKQLIQAYVAAGYVKIHIDMTMPAADDPKDKPLSAETIAERSAILCQVAEETTRELGIPPVVYVIGSEVPPPGGAKQQENGVEVTTPEDAKTTRTVFQETFARMGLSEAFARTIALVVQPGVEFDTIQVHDYQPEKALSLSQWIKTIPGMVFEAHSTDYQTGNNLRNLVRDHFAILKVGPELTFAYREAIFALDQIEKEWLSETTCQSQARQTILNKMTSEPQNWKKFYHGAESDILFQLTYSLSDRIRYYWNDERVTAEVAKLKENLNRNNPPFALCSQYLSAATQALREAGQKITPEALIHKHIQLVLERYQQAI